MLLTSYKTIVRTRTRCFLSTSASTSTSSSNTASTSTTASKDILLSSILKSFYLKVHPDKFAQLPSISTINNNSFSILREFLDHISNTANNKHFPTSKSSILPFYIWEDEERLLNSKGGSNKLKKLKHVKGKPIIRKLTLDLRTSGGMCKKLIKKSLDSIFVSCNINKNWTWDEKYWKGLERLTQKQLKEKLNLERQELEEVQATEKMTQEELELHYKEKAKQTEAKL